MRMRGVGKTDPRGVDLQMTPMIDIVFQMLIFFLLTFKIVSIEGDFSIKMPLAAQSVDAPQDIPLPPIRVRLVSTNDGSIGGIRMGEKPLESFAALHEEILLIVGGAAGPGASDVEVELDFDYDLRYEYVIEAVTAISGRIVNNQIVPLVEKIRLAPRQDAP